MLTMFDYSKDGDHQVRVAKDLTYATNGKGMWTDRARDVEISSIEVCLHTDSHDGSKYASLIVYVKDWNPLHESIIYTDPQFLKELRASLKEAGYLHTNTIGYSEVGLQGDDFVHFDVDPRFVTENF